LTVKVNGILGVCATPTACIYTISESNTPILQSFSRSGRTVTITLTDPG
jgi:hypothetical protein